MERLEDGAPLGGRAARIERALKDLTATLKAIHARLDDTDAAATMAATRSKRANVGMVVALVVAVGAIIVALTAHATANDVQDARQEARVSSCIQQNVVTQNIRVSLVLGLRSLVPPGQALTATQQQLVDRYQEQVTEALPYRDCSDKGISTFLSSPPTDPALQPPSTVSATTAVPSSGG
jgi:hypothetical protein